MIRAQLRNFLLILFCCLSSTLLYAQSSLTDQYSTARQMAKSGNTAGAIQILKQMGAAAVSEQEKVIQAYGRTLLAHLAFQTGDLEEAEKNSVFIKDYYPEIASKMEQRYLLALIYAKKQDFRNAIAYGTELPEGPLQTNFENAIKKELYGFPLEHLTFMTRQYPDFQPLVEVLYKKYKTDPSQARNPQYLDSLFKANQVLDYLTSKTGRLKEEYTVVVALPFYETVTDPTVKEKNWFVYDMYEGILLAKEQLAEIGVKINVHAFDTENSTNRVNELIRANNFSNVDLIIGPLFEKTSGPFHKISKELQIPMVNPATNNPSWLSRNPYAFLLNASYGNMGAMAAQYALDTIRQGALPYIVYGSTPEDYLMAEGFREQYAKAKMQLAAYEQFTTQGTGFDGLLATFDSIKLDTASRTYNAKGVVMAASEKEIAGINIISALQNLQANAPIFAPESWLKFRQISFIQLEKSDVHVLNNGFIDQTNPDVVAMDQSFIDRFGEIPSKYAYMGYEAMYTFGKLMGQHGTLFYEKMKSMPPFEGAVYMGFDFRDSNSNRFVPIMRFEGGEPTVVNGYMIDGKQ